VIAKMVDRGIDGASIVVDIAELDLEVVPLDRSPSRGRRPAAGGDAQRRPGVGIVVEVVR
jgi:hypothetical protein